MKVDFVEVGQVWVSNDPRDAQVQREVVEVRGGLATLRPVGGGRRTSVSVAKFLARQGKRSGYSIVSTGS